MEETQTSTTEITPTPPALPEGQVKKSGIKPWVIIVVGILILALTIGVIVLLMSTGSDNVGKIRDIFIIFMALESLLIGAVLIILVVQLARKIGVELSPEGYIRQDPRHRTNIPGVYAAGDVEGGYKQIVTAIGQATEAALSVYEDLNNPYWQGAEAMAGQRQ